MVLGAASCQKAGFSAEKRNGKALETITARIADDATRLGLEEATGKLAFEVGDKIFSWDEMDNYEYTCTSIDASGNAIFTSTSASGYTPIAFEGSQIFMIFAPGYTYEDLDSYNRLKIDISEIEAATFNELPVVMTAVGTADASGNCSLIFKNAVVPIKVTDAVIEGAANTELTKVSASGVYSAMTYSIDADYNLVVTPDVLIGSVTNATPVTTDGSGKASFWLASFVTPEGGKANDVVFSAFTATDEYTSEVAAKTLNAGEFVKYDGKTFSKIPGDIQVGETVYTDMNAAVAAINSATSPVTAKFLKNVALQDSIIITNMNAEVTIDFNGKTVLAPDAQACGLKISGATTVVNITDSKGGGKIDHTFAGTTPTVVVEAGTLNLISGSLCNTTGGGYGRVAVTVSAQKGTSTFNVKGGAVIGSRAILVGSGLSGNMSNLYVYDGLVKGTTTGSGYYPAIGNSDYGGYAHVEVLGGTVMTSGMKAKSAIHIKKAEGVDVIIGGAEGKVPYIYNAKGEALVTGSNTDCEATYKIYELYGNLDNNGADEEYPVFGDCDITPLDPALTDTYGNVYKFHIKAK